MFTQKKSRRGGDLACIFVHAGAGYHSIQNENIHLQACNDAAKAGMAVLRSGGSAVDAVEIAVKILEDREITNAGYGSNLTMDGVVECDAVVVDHFGRSGGVGAVAQIKNPISLARLLLDHSTTQLSLKRVPPNLLVGQGATDFAYDQGMPVLPHNALVSPAAQERWRRWRRDLIEANRRRRQVDAAQYGVSPAASEPDLDFIQERHVREGMRKGHTKALLAGVWNEAQPASPPPSDDRGVEELSSSSSAARSSVSMHDAEEEHTPETTPDSLDMEFSDPYGPPAALEEALRNPSINSSQSFFTRGSIAATMKNGSHDGHESGTLPGMFDKELSETDSGPYQNVPITQHLDNSLLDGSSGSESDSTTTSLRLPSLTPSPPHLREPGTPDPDAFPLESTAVPLLGTPDEKHQEDHIPQATTPLSQVSEEQPSPSSSDDRQDREDQITDTVGVIAMDCYGNIACGASSGGIGMKYRGRMGPAALVGIGAAVVPEDSEDSHHTAVATVTSGTGEHMATTMAAGVCAERIYHGVRNGRSGRIEEVEDDEAMQSFIAKDFMGHPSVVNSNSTGAIGVLTAKRQKDGIYLYFAHNTDSFALASMHSDEIKPMCTMSRSKGNGVIAQGGRAVRHGRKK